MKKIQFVDMMKIWVVETEDNDVWLPTTGVGLSRSETRVEAKRWKDHCPDDKFRVRKYVRDEKNVVTNYWGIHGRGNEDKTITTRKASTG